MTEPKPKDPHKKLDVGPAIFMMLLCMFFALFPSAFSKNPERYTGPTRVRAHATVLKIMDLGTSKLVTYSRGRRTQAFSTYEWPDLTVGSKVEIVYDPRTTFATMLPPGTPPDPEYPTWGDIARALLFIVCFIMLVGFLRIYAQGDRQKDTPNDQTTL
jgi:hypothetical protein